MTQYRKDNLLCCIFVTLDVFHFSKFELNFSASKNTAKPKNTINHPSIVSHHHHHPSKEKTQKNNHQQKEEEVGGEEEMVRLVCLDIQHNIGKTTYYTPYP